MTRNEFAVLVRGSLHETILIVSLSINKSISAKNIRIINHPGDVIAEGWDKCTEYLVSNMYFGENEIKPCADLLIHDFDEKTVEFKVYIAGYSPRPYTLNRSGGVGPFIKAYNPKMLIGHNYDIDTVTCYRPVNQRELDLVEESENTKWPQRLPEQPIFYVATNEEYALQLTKWNLTNFGVGYVMKFKVSQEFMFKYPIKCVGGKNHTEWWIPAEDLAELNENIVGLIEPTCKLGK